jgi:murein DD-endopeptidase MepM/ murein hydrolase activator NlpD
MSGFVLPTWKITSPFGVRVNPVTGVRRLHGGTDFGQDSGAAIKAVAPGTVESKGVNLNKQSGYGHWVRVRHYDGSRGMYAHLVAASPLTVGQAVDHNTVIGGVGSTGASTGPHLHLEIIVNGTPVDPIPYAKARPIQVGPAPTAGGRVHVVARGESLSGIAGKYGTTWQALYAANKSVIGANPNRIFAGQALTVSSAAPAAAPVAPPAPVQRVHTVGRGESLSSIAGKYKTTWQKIYADNRGVVGSNPNKIFAGQRLVIN